jgi:uncharacterized tellurite resistance protein B-like protein
MLMEGVIDMFLGSAAGERRRRPCIIVAMRARPPAAAPRGDAHPPKETGHDPMLKAIRDFFEQRIGAAAAPDHEGHRLRLATAALLVEVVRGDGGVAPAELEALLAAIGARFDLEPGEAAELVALAEHETRQANDTYQFTSLINRSFSPAEKLRVVELMWQVAYADATLSAHEQHVLRKVAELLHVPHGDYIAAKMRAKEAAG